MSSSTNSADQNGFKKSATLGSKSRSFIPMTPRNLKVNNKNDPNSYRNDFAKQVAEHSSRDRDVDGQPPQKKFKSNSAPKGTKLASGYVDRAQERQRRQDDGDGDERTTTGDGDKAQRLNALEEMLKLQQIDRATFEGLREEIGIGGDISSTHLVKGLDFKLLERVRRGEDLEKAAEHKEKQEEEVTEVDVDDELERALSRDVATTKESQGQQDDEDLPDRDTSSHNGRQDVPLTRDEILQRMKQRRKNPNAVVADESVPDTAAARNASSDHRLDQSRFRKLESKPKANRHKFTETINGRRREVLVITDKEGNTKRKVRWLDPEPESVQSTAQRGKTGSTSGANDAWGGDLPAEILAKQKAAAEEEAARLKAAEEEDGDDDIFGGVAAYDPLAGIDDEDDEKVENANEKDVLQDEDAESKQQIKNVGAGPGTVEISASRPLKSTSKPRNYFATNDAENGDSDHETTAPSHDPAILAALQRAAQIRQQEEAEAGDGESRDATARTSDSQERNQALLAKLKSQSGYDDVDMDMGFDGNTRYDDDYGDEGDKKQKLSQWTGLGEDADGVEDDSRTKRGGDTKRKRGGKKKKGDKNSFADVMSVIQGRKKD